MDIVTVTGLPVGFEKWMCRMTARIPVATVYRVVATPDRVAGPATRLILAIYSSLGDELAVDAVDSRRRGRRGEANTNLLSGPRGVVVRRSSLGVGRLDGSDTELVVVATHPGARSADSVDQVVDVEPSAGRSRTVGDRGR